MLSTLMLMFIVASCNKDQRAVKTLDGKWQQTKMNGNPIDADEIYTIEFKACKLKKEEYCVVTVSEVYFGQTFTFTGDFKVIDKGETLELRFTSQGTTQISRFKIKELSKSTLIIEVTEGTSVYTEEYKKI
jgi:hypothetical protein